MKRIENPCLGDLRLRDVVDLGPGEYTTGTVVRVTDVGNGLIQVEVVRPYIHTGDVQYGGTNPDRSYVLDYIGTERVTLIGEPSRSSHVDVLRRGGVR